MMPKSENKSAIVKQPDLHWFHFRNSGLSNHQRFILDEISAANYHWFLRPGVHQTQKKRRNIAIYRTNSDGSFHFSETLNIGIHLNGNIGKTDIVVAKLEKCPFSIMRMLESENKSFLFFLDNPPAKKKIVKKFAANWKKGVIQSEKIVIPYGDDYSIDGYFQKTYLKSRRKISHIFTNLSTITSEGIESLSKQFPYDL